MAALCEPFRNHADQRLFIAAGAGAGVAAAFSAPVGGMLFALEEGGLTWSHPQMWRVLICSTIAVSTVTLIGDIGKALDRPLFHNTQLIEFLLPQPGDIDGT